MADERVARITNEECVLVFTIDTVTVSALKQRPGPKLVRHLEVDETENKSFAMDNHT